MIKKALIFVFVFIFLLVIFGLISFFPSWKRSNASLVFGKQINRTGVGAEQINFVLYHLKAYELHNPPLSGNTPKIEFVIDGEIYSSEIIKGKIITVKGRKGEPDIRIIISREEFLNALDSDIKLYFQKSVSQGKTKIELLAGKTELFTKGYLSLYKEITGKNFPV